MHPMNSASKNLFQFIDTHLSEVHILKYCVFANDQAFSQSHLSDHKLYTFFILGQVFSDFTGQEVRSVGLKKWMGNFHFQSRYLDQPSLHRQLQFLSEVYEKHHLTSIKKFSKKGRKFLPKNWGHLWNQLN